jgi:hypothetical protein
MTRLSVGKNRYRVSFVDGIRITVIPVFADSIIEVERYVRNFIKNHSERISKPGICSIMAIDDAAIEQPLPFTVFTF